MCSNGQVDRYEPARSFSVAVHRPIRNPLLAARLCHADILWADEDYHLAAAIQVLYGKIPYRDFWYDKPFLNLAACLLFAAKNRVAAAAGVRDLRNPAMRPRICIRQPSLDPPRRLRRRVAVRVFIDVLFPRAHSYAGARYFDDAAASGGGLSGLARPSAARRAPVCEIATWFNVKGIFVLAACAAFGWSGLPLLALGFLIPNALALGWLAGEHALAGHWRQVWEWGFLYSRSPMPVSAGFRSLLNWTGFHAALALATAVYFRRKSAERRAFAIWLAMSFAGTAIGLRFAPRYLDQLLPPLWILGAREA